MLLRLLVAWEARVRAGGPQPSSGPGADRFLVAAAAVFGLSIGNHSLTLLLAPPVALFVLAVDREIWRDRRLVALCLGAAAAAVLVYLELPLRAGPFRAALVYGRPETWDGFWYVALGEQFRTSLVDPFGDLPAKAGSLVARAVDQFGPLTPLVPLALVATVVRQPRYALLTVSAVAITCLFAASYRNADVGRYYLGPVADGLDLAGDPGRHGGRVGGAAVRASSRTRGHRRPPSTRRHGRGGSSRPCPRPCS